MSDIKRYSLDVGSSGGDYWVDTEESNSGEWVLYSDVQSRLSESEVKRKDCEDYATFKASETEDYRRLLTEARDALQEIYANNGEDERVSDICSPLIDKLYHFTE